MKLHLSKSLRKAILATFAVLAPLSLSLASASAVESPRTIQWDSHWNADQILQLYGLDSQYPIWEWADPLPDLEVLGTREVESGGLGWNNFSENFYLYTGGDGSTLYAISANGVTSTNVAKPIYNSLAGGYSLAEPVNPIASYALYMDVSGTFEAVAGGDICYNGRNWGTTTTPANRYIYLRDGAKVGVVTGYNLTGNDVANKNFLGSVYISVDTSSVYDSVVGRTTHGSCIAYGDAAIFVYKVLSRTEGVNVHLSTELEDSVLWSSAGAGYGAGSIVAGAYDADNATINGNSLVVVDMTGLTGYATFAKALVGGSCSITYSHDQFGDSVVYIKNADKVPGFSNHIVGQSMYLSSSKWIGNSSVCISNSSSAYSGFVVAGNFNYIPGLNSKMYGDTLVSILGSANASFSSPVCASHALYSVTQSVVNSDTTYYTDYNAALSHDVNLWVDARLTGAGGLYPTAVAEGANQSIVFVRNADSQSTLVIDGGTFRDRVLAGDYLYDDDNVTGAYYSPQAGKFWYVRHYDFMSSIGTTNVSISGGTFTSVVQGGTYVCAQNYGGYTANVSPNEGSAPQELLVALRIKNINMNLTGGTYGISGEKGYSIIGAYDLTDTASSIDDAHNYMTSVVDAEVENVKIRLENVVVNGEIIGGSHVKACESRSYLVDANNAETLKYKYSVRHGDITLSLVSGQFNGDVYAAGYYDTASGKYNGITAPMYVDNVTVEIGSQAMFGKVIVNGAYKSSISSTSATQNISVVGGDKTLSFTDPVTYTNLNRVEFVNFDVIDVVSSLGYVTLDQTLQRIFTGTGERCIKTGAGTLSFTNQHSSILSNFTVAEGCLALPANSNNYATGAVMATLTVVDNAMLDISQGNCGTRGRVIMETGSKLGVQLKQDPTRVTSVEWGDVVNIYLENGDLTNGAYTIKLFDGLTVGDISGLTMKTVEELGLTETFVGAEYGARAEGCVELWVYDGVDAAGVAQYTAVAMDNAYLILDADGVLSLSTQIGRTLYWNGASGDEWNADDNNKKFVSSLPAGADTFFFRNLDAVWFVGDGSATDQNVVVNETLKPDSISVKNGSYVFSGSGTGVLELDGNLSLTDGATVVVGDTVTLMMNPETSNIVVSDDSSLTVNNDLSVYGLDNSGVVNVQNASLTVAKDIIPSGTGGTLNVGDDLTLGGNATMHSLTVGDQLTFAGVLSILSETDDATGAVTDAGSLTAGTVAGGTLSLGDGVQASLTAATEQTLTRLSGSGDLQTADGSTLELAESSQIGNLDATGATLRLSNDLTVDGTLAASRVEIASLGVDRLSGSATAPFLSVGTLDCTDIRLAQDAAQDIHLISSGEYVLVQAGAPFGPLTVNGATSAEITSGRYTFTANVDNANNAVTLTAAVSSPDYYVRNVRTTNASAGAAALDSLFADGTVDTIAPNGALASVIVSMDNSIAAGNQAGADELAAAASGASLAALGCAFSDDVQRQLKAIRNRTTTMGANECETREGMPAFNAWINAEGNYNKLSSDGTAAGYTLSSWGGTVGFDVDLSCHLTVGMAVTAMYGDYSADAVDSISGDFDTQYVTLFARYAARAWVHTFIASVGRADVSLERNVTGNGVSYHNTGDTDGTAFGFMYEIGHVFAIDDEATACIEPVVNVSFSKTTLGGFSEQGTDAAVKTDDLEMTRCVIGAGARLQGIAGTTVYNRTSILEGRALVKANLGDNSCDATNRFAVGGVSGSYESAEQGSVGFEVGIGITVPVGGEGGSIFADFSADINSGYSNLNGTIGYRVNF